MNWKRFDFKKIGICLIALFFLWLNVGKLITKPVSKNNTTLINGHFVALRKCIVKHCVSYNLYISEYQDYFKIGADNADDFYSGSFESEVGKGTPVKIYVNQPTPYLSMQDASVVCVVANDKDYLSFDSVNAEIATEKKWIPFISIGFILLFGIVIYRKELKAKFKYS